MLFSLLTGSAPLFEGSNVLALTAVMLLAAATIWMASRMSALCRPTRGTDARSRRFAWRAGHVPVLVRARRPDTAGRPRPRAPGTDGCPAR